MFNIYVLLRQDAFHRASHFIYLNILLMDALNAIGGILWASFLETHEHVKAWYDALRMFRVMFKGEIILLFGLSIVRLLALKLSTALIIDKLKYVAYTSSALAWTVGIGLLIYRDLVKLTWQNYLGTNLCFLLIVIITAGFYLYIVISIAQNDQSELYARANKTACLIFLSFVFAYIYFTFAYCYFIYIIIEKKRRCSPRTWLGVFGCWSTSQVGLGFMLMQSLANNLILITQDEVMCFIKANLRFYKALWMEWRPRNGYETIV